MTKAPDDAVIEVESEIEHLPPDAAKAAGELRRLYRQFPLPPMEFEDILPGQALAESDPAVAGRRPARGRDGWWMDALAALLAAGLLAMVLLGVDWKLVGLFRGGAAETAEETR